jgi:hypothetical protein
MCYKMAGDATYLVGSTGPPEWHLPTIGSLLYACEGGDLASGNLHKKESFPCV